MKVKVKTRNKILISVMSFLGLFIIFTVGFYAYKGWQWDALFPYVLGVGGLEGVMTGVIAILSMKKDGER